MRIAPPRLFRRSLAAMVFAFSPLAWAAINDSQFEDPALLGRILSRDNAPADMFNLAILKISAWERSEHKPEHYTRGSNRQDYLSILFRLIGRPGLDKTPDISRDAQYALASFPNLAQFNREFLEDIAGAVAQMLVRNPHTPIDPVGSSYVKYFPLLFFCELARAGELSLDAILHRYRLLDAVQVQAPASLPFVVTRAYVLALVIHARKDAKFRGRLIEYINYADPNIQRIAFEGLSFYDRDADRLSPQALAPVLDLVRAEHLDIAAKAMQVIAMHRATKFPLHPHPPADLGAISVALTTILRDEHAQLDLRKEALETLTALKSPVIDSQLVIASLIRTNCDENLARAALDFFVVTRIEHPAPIDLLFDQLEDGMYLSEIIDRLARIFRNKPQASLALLVKLLRKSAEKIPGYIAQQGLSSPYTDMLNTGSSYFIALPALTPTTTDADTLDPAMIRDLRRFTRHKHPKIATAAGRGLQMAGLEPETESERKPALTRERKKEKPVLVPSGRQIATEIAVLFADPKQELDYRLKLGDFLVEIIEKNPPDVASWPAVVHILRDVPVDLRKKSATQLRQTAGLVYLNLVARIPFRRDISTLEPVHREMLKTVLEFAEDRDPRIRDIMSLAFEVYFRKLPLANAKEALGIASKKPPTPEFQKKSKGKGKGGCQGPFS